MSFDILDQVTSSLTTQSVSIEEFAESDEFCGKRLYPRQRALLKLIFLEEMTGEEEDILDYWIAGGRNGTEVVISPLIRERRDYLREMDAPHFREVVLVGGRRSSKGFVTGIAMAKVMYDALLLQDPGQHFGIDVEKEIYFSCVASAEIQAKKFQYADLVSTVESCRAFEPYMAKSLETEFGVMTPSDQRKLEAAKSRNRKVQRHIAKLRGNALASNASTLRGSATMALAQPLSAKVLTPQGWSTMGELQVGDEVVGGDGLPVRVLKTHDRGTRATVRVRFSDGSSTVCSEDHLWTLRQKHETTKTAAIREFADDLWKQNGAQGPHAKWATMPNPVVQYAPVELPLDPYLVGALIGDGSYTGRHVTFYSAEEEAAELVAASLPANHELRKDATNALQYRVSNCVAHHNVVIRNLRMLGMQGTKGPQKRIPEIYKRATVQDRFSLLQGLMDTDGSVNGTSVRFGVSSRGLAEDVAEVVRSLGGYATIGTRPQTGGFGGEACFDIHTVCISGLDATRLFRLQRKLDRCAQYSRYQRRLRRVVAVEPLGDDEVRCITVANEDGLYLTDDLLVTHNCIDEMAHMLAGESRASAEQVYDAAVPSLDQFGQASIIFCNSSPYTKVGKFYERYVESHRVTEDGKPGAPLMFSFQFPSWALYDGYQDDPKQSHRKAITVSADWDPEEKDENGKDRWSQADKAQILIAKQEEAQNPDKYKVERRGRFAEVIDAYLNPDMVNRIYAGRPFNEDNQGIVYKPFNTNWGETISYNYKYAAHLDPSSTTAGFGFAIGHTEELPDPQGQIGTHVVFDIIKRWEPQTFPNGVIDWEVIIEELVLIADMFRPYTITFDQFQSHAPMQDLNRRLHDKKIGGIRVHENFATNEKNFARAEIFKTATYLGLIHAPNDTDHTEWSAQELKFLQQINTAGRFPRIDKQDVGPVQTKDMADCMMTVTEYLIGNLIASEARESLSEGLAMGAKGGFGVRSDDRATPDELAGFYPGSRQGEQRIGGRGGRVSQGNRARSGRPIPRRLPGW